MPIDRCGELVAAAPTVIDVYKRQKSGSKLPSQNELVEYFGVSRTGIREALQMMAVLNLIEIKPGLGCFVKRVSPEYIIHADVLSILLEKESVMDLSLIHIWCSSRPIRILPSMPSIYPHCESLRRLSPNVTINPIPR